MWSDSLVTLRELVAKTKDRGLRSGICLALGTVRDPDQEAKDAWLPILKSWYSMEADGGTHSAARWVLSQWGLPVPKIEKENRPPSNRNWWEEPNGLRFVKIRSGSVKGENNNVKVLLDFWLSDAEITVQLFRKFMADQQYHALNPDLKPDWNGPFVFENDDLPDLPVQQVSWNEAVLFCNWLSWKLGLKPCYWVTKQEEGMVIICDPGADGIRLPISSEWEYACRCATTTKFSFGDYKDDLLDYGWYALNSNHRTQQVRSKLCNAWGLFDMHGNVYEWCWPTMQWSLKNASNRVGRSGGFNQESEDCRSSNAVVGFPTYRQNDLGFRVAQGRLPDFSYRQKKFMDVRSEEWRDAMELQMRLIANSENSALINLYFQLSPLALANKDYKRFEWTCQKLFKEWEATKNSSAASCFLYASLVHPVNAKLTLQRVEVAKSLLAINTVQVRLLAASLFRAGEFKNSLDQFEIAQKTWSPLCWDYCFMAMAHFQLGDVEMAKEFFQKAETSPERSQVSWDTQIAYHELLSEAKQLIYESK